MYSTDKTTRSKDVNQVLYGKKGLPVGSVIKNPTADAGDAASIPT